MRMRCLRFLVSSLCGLCLLSVPLAALAKEEKVEPVKAAIYKSWVEAAPVTAEGPNGTVLIPAFPDKAWWRKFNDAYLDEYTAEAVRNNPSLEASVQRIAQARAQVTQSFARQLPSLSLNPGFNRIGLPDLALGGFSLPKAIKLFMLAFQPAFELDLFGRNRDMTQSAKQELAATEQDSRAFLIALQGEVATAYINLLRADALVASQQETMALLTRINELKRNQYQGGLSDYDEVVRSERDVAQAQTSLTAYRQQQALYAHQLSVLLGRTPESEAQIARSALAKLQLPPETEAGIPSELVSRRPDILAGERRLERASIDVRVARKAFLPAINLGGMFSMAGTNAKDAVDTGNLVNMQSVSVSQPLFQGGRLKGGLRLQQARQREQIENYRQTVLTAFREVEDQLALLRTSYDTLNSNAHRLALTEQSLRITESRYQQGLIPRLNVLQAQSERAQYEQMNMQSKADALVATVNLYKALGGGL